MSGRLYGLGVGPGDPDLITLKAQHILGDVPVIAYPAPLGGQSLVRTIAQPHIPAGRIEIVIETPMAVDRFPAQDVYDRYAQIIATHLDDGRDVAVLCEGDPFFYGSFMYIFERLAEHYPTSVVPGVSSLTAVAAVAGLPLTEREEVLTVIPATMPEDKLATYLQRTNAAAIMKIGRHLGKVRALLEKFNLADHAHYVERATMANQRVLPLHAVGNETAPYFSMIVVRRERPVGDETIHVPEGAAIIALTAGAQELAGRLQPMLPDSTTHGLRGRADNCDVVFTEAMEHVRMLFSRGVPIIGVCASGILIRAVAPVLADKRTEPPVVAVAEDGSHVIPLLGGHHGANRLARVIAGTIGGIAAVTTSGELKLGVALDEPPPGWRVGDPSAVKAVTAALLSGEPVALAVEAGNADWLNQGAAHFTEEAAYTIRITDKTVAPTNAVLALHPPVLSVGVGCERGAAPDEVIELVRSTLREQGLSPEAVACVVSADLKADEPAVHAVAQALEVPARFYSVNTLEAETPRLANPSAEVFRAIGCHGVAEAAALAACGETGMLVAPKHKSPRATCAIARATAPIDPTTVGLARGRLTVIGIGPGNPAWRTPEATAALKRCTDVVGYGLYLDLIADVIAGKHRHVSELSEEEARVHRALELACDGRDVALVSSGDAGIYGLATLVFELLEREDRADWNRIGLSVVPGLSALQAASARIGAATGHDFCTVSLSDLLTPWPEIERRLTAAADGDFVVALYNPVSKRRREHLNSARDILLRRRPGHTPVALVRNVGRTGESVSVIRLDALSVDHADMLTLVLIGNTQSRRIERGRNTWIYTPRGYARKSSVSSTTQGLETV